MRIIITESQLTILDLFLEKQKYFDYFFNQIIQSKNFYFNYVIFRPLEKTIDLVVDKIYDEFAYSNNSFTGEDSIKDYLRDHYSNKIKNRYKQLKKEHPQHKF